MLLFGSRAIAHHFPDFRPPRDWDLVGTRADIERLDGVLPRSAEHQQTRYKVHYQYEGRLVEVVDGAEVPYWGRMADLFATEPVVQDPVLGRMNVAPPGFLLLSKQCGLIYRIVHWHKNLEDLYFLRDRMPTMPPEIAALVGETQAESRRTYLPTTGGRSLSDVLPCHPAVAAADRGRHLDLHERLHVGPRSARDEDPEWRGYPELRGDARRQRMIDLFAEEAMVLAAESWLSPLTLEEHREPSELVRYSLRQMITGRLPEEWRYFGVNYYREIYERTRFDWTYRLYDLLPERRFARNGCVSALNCEGGLPLLAKASS